MNNKQLEELIRKEVWSAAAAELKRQKEAAASAPRPDAAPKMNDREFNNLLFNGGYEDMGFHKTVGLNENQTPPTISSGEIQEFERKFADILSKYPNTTVSFDQQGRAKKSMMFKQGDKGIAVTASGYVQAGNEGTLRWMFSIPNGCRIETEGFELTQENRDMLADLYNFYNEWQQEWRQKLTGNQTSKDEEGGPEAEQPGDVPGLDMAPGGGAPNVPGDASMGVGVDAANAGAQPGATSF